MKRLLRTGMMLTALGSGSHFAMAQEETDTAAADAAPAQAPVIDPSKESLDGKLVFSLPTLEKKWESQAVINSSRDKIAHLVVDEDVIIVQSNTGLVTVFNAENGRKYWSSQVGRNDEVSVPAATDSQMLVISTGLSIHAFDKFSGLRLFSYSLPHVATAAPTLARREITEGDNVRIARWLSLPVSDGSVVTYDVDILERTGKLGTLPPKVAKAMSWRFATSEIIPFPIVAGDDRLIFATQFGNVHCVDMMGADAGESRFQFILRHGTSAPPLSVRLNNHEYFLAASTDNRLFCAVLKQFQEAVKDGYVTTPSGTVLWTIPLSRNISQPMMVVGSDLFFVTDDGVLQKHSVVNGDPALINEGVSAVVTEAESLKGALRPYGASVEFEADGLLEFSPIRVANRSTGQIVRSITIDLTKTPLVFRGTADDAAIPRLDVEGDSGLVTGLRSSTLSPDGKLLTLEFNSFQPNDLFYFHPDLGHTDLGDIKLTAEMLDGADIKVLVAPERTVVASNASVDGDTQAFPPRTLKGNFRRQDVAWKINGVKKLLAVSDTSVYYLDKNHQIVAVTRHAADQPVSISGNEYNIHQFNDRTDRVIVSSVSGSVALFAERRIELGILPLPLANGVYWTTFPKVELDPEFARFHRDPGGQPITIDVPKKDPAPAKTE
ncbi:MAG: PQQ-binding-like beta-propeller repeat protein [Planctomycetaceae bacterium]